MLKSHPLLLAVLLTALLIASCAPAVPTATPSPILTEQPVIPVTGAAIVQTIEIQVQNNPLQINAVLRGQLPELRLYDNFRR